MNKDYITKENILSALSILLVISCLIGISLTPTFSEHRVNFYKNETILIEDLSTQNEIDNGMEFVNNQNSYNIKIFHSDDVYNYWEDFKFNSLDLYIEQVFSYNSTHEYIWLPDFYPDSQELSDHFSDGSQAIQFIIVYPKGEYNFETNSFKENASAIIIEGIDSDYTYHVFKTMECKNES